MWVPFDNDPQSPFPLVDFNDADDFAPLPTNYTLNLPGGETQDKRLQVDFSAQVGLYGMASATTQTSYGADKTSGGLFGEQRANGGPNQLSYTVRCGVGYRTYLLWWDVAASANVDNVAQATLAAEGGLANTSYAIEVFGIDSYETLTCLPRPGVLSEEAHKEVITKLNALIAKLNTPGGPLKPAPLAIDFLREHFERAIRKSLEVVFAADQIRRGVTLNDALAKLGNLNATLGSALAPTASGVQRVYETWKATDAAGLKSAGRLAKAWLSKTVHHDAVESEIVGTRADADPSFDASAQRSLRRVIARSQLVDASGSLDFKYGDAASVNSNTSSKRLIYDLQIEHVETASQLASYSGVEVSADILSSKTTIQGSFSQIKAATKLGVSKASFNVHWDGLGTNLGIRFLSSNDFGVDQLEEKLRVVDAGINAIAATHELSPKSRPFVWAREFDLHSFPSARVVYLTLNRLAHLTDDLTGGSMVAGGHRGALDNLKNVGLPTASCGPLCGFLGATTLNSGPSDRKKIADWLMAVAPWF